MHSLFKLTLVSAVGIGGCVDHVLWAPVHEIQRVSVMGVAIDEIGRPLAGAFVEICGPSFDDLVGACPHRETAETDAEGRFRFQRARGAAGDFGPRYTLVSVCTADERMGGLASNSWNGDLTATVPVAPPASMQVRFDSFAAPVVDLKALVRKRCAARVLRP